MKVLLITNLYPNPREPNRGIFVEKLVHSLKGLCDVRVVSPLPYFPKTGLFRKLKSWHRFSLVPYRYVMNGIEVTSPKYIALPKLGFLHAFFFYLSVGPAVRRLLLEDKADIINAHWIFPDGVASARLGNTLGIPVVLSAHGTDLNMYLKMRLRREQILKALRRSSCITVVSEQHKALLEAGGIDPAKIYRVNNGYDAAFDVRDRYKARREIGLEVDAKTVLFLGRLVEVKGFKYLFEAMRILKDEYPGKIRLVVVGDGPLRAGFESRAAQSGMKDIVRFIGEVPHSRINRYITACDVLCLPSVSEGCPTAVIEALASGRPVAASRVGEVPFLINRGNGIVFNVGDVKEIAVSLSTALNRNWDEEKIRGTISGFTWGEIAREYLRIYAEAVKRC